MRRAYLLIFPVAFILAGCISPDTEYSGPGGEAFVESEVAGLTAVGPYTYEVDEFAGARQSRGAQVRSRLVNLAVADRSDRANRIDLDDVQWGRDAPAAEHMVGHGGYVVLNGLARATLSEPGVVLGAHVSMTALGTSAHLGMRAGTEFAVRFTGRSSEGELTRTVKAVLASATPRGVQITSDWMWVDLSLLGPVREVLVEVESPLALEERVDSIAWAVLLDNLTVSRDFHSDPDYYTLAVVPETGAYVGDAAPILRAQIEFLRDMTSDEKIVAASFPGRLVSDAGDYEQWEEVAESLLSLGRTLPIGLAPAPSDYSEPGEPDEGAPEFLEVFPRRRFWNHDWWVGRSDDELSSCQLVDTPIGDLLLLHLSVDTPVPSLEWAQEIIDSNRGVPIAVFLNRYLDSGGRKTDRVFYRYMGGLAPEEFFTTFIRDNPQVFLIASVDLEQHVEISRHRNGSHIIEMSVGWSDRPEDSSGFMLLLRFYPARNEFRALTYSPWRDEYLVENHSVFSGAIDLGGADQ
jgi:hypothetical protein